MIQFKRVLSIMMILVISISGIQVSAANRQAQVDSFSGDVRLLKAGGEKTYAPEIGMLLEEGTTIITGEGGYITVIIDGNKEVKVDEKSYVSFEELRDDDGEKTSIRLLAGQLWSKIKTKLGVDDSYEIKTPNSIMGARGTEYIVSFEQKSEEKEAATSLTVVEGTVEAQQDKAAQSEGDAQNNADDKKSVYVRAGETIQTLGTGMTSNQDLIKQVDYEKLDLFALDIFIEDFGKNPEAYKDKGLVLENLQSRKSLLEEQKAQNPNPLETILPKRILDNTTMTSNQVSPLVPKYVTSSSKRTPSPYIGITETSLNLVLGIAGYQLRYGYEFGDALDRTIVWRSLDTKVATVDTNGYIELTGVGTSYIRAESVDGVLGDQCIVNVANSTSSFVPVTGVSVVPREMGLIDGESEHLMGSVLPTSATNKGLVWSSDNPNVATVDNAGTVKAIDPGVTKIRVTSSEGGFSDTCEVTVSKKAVTKINIIEGSMVIDKGAQKPLTLQIFPSDATNQDITWTVSDEAVISVDGNGLVTGKALGTAKVTATNNDSGYKDESSITVSRIPLTDVSLNQAAITLDKNQVQYLEPIFVPMDATNKEIVWTSDDSSVATVDSNGKVTGLTKGFTKIRGKSVDGNFEASCDVTVEIHVKAIVIEEASINIGHGEEYQIKYQVFPEDADNQSVTWLSSDDNIATVDTSGKITAKTTTGSAIIIATTTDGSLKDSTEVNVALVEVLPTFIDFTQSSLTLEVGETGKVEMTILPEDVTDKGIIYTSSDENFVTVDGSGTITAISPTVDPVEIKATSVANPSLDASLDVTVKPVEVTGLNITESVELKMGGDSRLLSYQVLPINASNAAVTFISSDTSVVIVDANGTITPVGPGEATITTTTVDGDFSKETTVSVAPLIIAVTDVILSDEDLNLYKGNQVTIEALVEPIEATDQSILWQTSNAAVATVDQTGKVTAISIGSATISVTTNNGGLTDQCLVTVIPLKVTSINMDVETLDLQVDAIATLNYQISPAEATNQEVAWSSSNSSVVSVDDRGEITALKIGSATITVETNDGGYSDSCVVTATPIPVTSILLDKNSIGLDRPNSHALSYSVEPFNATSQGVTWSTSDSSIATVDSSGLVTAVSGGQAEIRVTSNENSNKYATCTVDVSYIYPDSVTIRGSQHANLVGGTLTLTAELQPSDVDDPSVVWTSSDDTIASVDNNGVVKGESLGKATITATSHGKVSSVTVYTVEKYDDQKIEKVESFDTNKDGSIDKIIIKAKKDIIDYNALKALEVSELGTLVFDTIKMIDEDEMEIVLLNDVFYTGPLDDLYIPEFWLIFEENHGSNELTLNDRSKDEADPIVKIANEGYDNALNQRNKLQLIFSEDMKFKSDVKDGFSIVTSHDDDDEGEFDDDSSSSKRTYNLVMSDFKVNDVIKIKDSHKDFDDHHLIEKTFKLVKVDGEVYWVEN